MGHWSRRVALLIALGAAVALAGTGQTRASTTPQIAQGSQIFQAKCVTCHGVNLEGKGGPALIDSALITAYGEDGVALRSFIQRMMPRRDPGTLSAEESLAVTQFILSRNGIGPDGFAEPAFRALWERADGPVAAGQTTRGWLWGPVTGWTEARWEPYAEAAGGRRLVQYFEKTRMEIGDLNGDHGANNIVSTGLLARELVSGRIATGDSAEMPHRPADTITIAGDPDDANGPTFGSFAKVATLAPGQNAATSRVGQPVTQTINRAGATAVDDSLARHGVTIGSFSDQLGHNIPGVFQDYLNGLFDPWYAASGLPITEPFWAKVKVGGAVKDVLIQVFERRVLTYTPTNNEGSKVEMGNVGLQYYRWRYGA